MNISERATDLIEEFSAIKDWEDRYKRIISLGKGLADLTDEHKIEKNLVKGCQSQVWLVANLADGKVQFQAGSDAVIVRGLVSILVGVYSDATPDEILSTPPEFLEKMGFRSNLSPSRANGLYSMVKQIQYYALAFKSLLSR